MDSLDAAIPSGVAAKVRSANVGRMFPYTVRYERAAPLRGANWRLVRAGQPWPALADRTETLGCAGRPVRRNSAPFLVRAPAKFGKSAHARRMRRKVPFPPHSVLTPARPGLSIKSPPVVSGGPGSTSRASAAPQVRALPGQTAPAGASPGAGPLFYNFVRWRADFARRVPNGRAVSYRFAGLSRVRGTADRWRAWRLADRGCFLGLSLICAGS